MGLALKLQQKIILFGKMDMRRAAFSELNRIAALIPNCLRLAIYVTAYRPKLATDGWPFLIRQEFHLLPRTPFAGRATTLQLFEKITHKAHSVVY